MGLIREMKDLRRANQIVGMLFRYELGYLIHDLDLKKHLPWTKRIQVGEFEHKHDTRRAARKLREVFEALGPTFIKLGQLLSLRSDLIPEEFCDEFRGLQNHVEPMDADTVKRTLEAELGKKTGRVFRKFDKEHVASASVAQVHRAVLKSGKKVAVKVQRPGIKDVMQEDIDIMYYIASKMEKHKVYSRYNPVQVVDEFKAYTENELDFLKEAKNCLRFRKNFRDSRNVYFPKPYLKHTTHKVLVMEYIDGIMLSDINAIKKKHMKRKEIVLNGLRSVYRQIFDHGFFHADSHPSNIFVMHDKRLAYVDFGIVGRIDDEMKIKMLKFLWGLVERDIEMIVKQIIAIGEAKKKIDMPKLRKEIKEIVDDWDGGIGETRPSVVLYRIIQKSIGHGMQVPADVILVIKALLTMEGTGCELYPKLDLVKESKPYLKKLLKRYMSPKKILKKAETKADRLLELFSALPKHAETLLEKADSGEFGVRLDAGDVSGLQREMRYNNERRNLSMVLAALLIASAVMLQKPQALLLGIPMSTLGFIASAVIAIYLLGGKK